MPNYKLSGQVINDIKIQIDSKLLNKCLYDEEGFPLTPEDVQLAIMNPEHVAKLRELEAEGVQNLPKEASFFVFLSPEDVPGLVRGALVHFTFPHQLFIPRHMGYYYGPQDRCEYKQVKDMFRLNNLPLEAAERVARWANGAVRARRMRRMVLTMMNRVFTKCKTTGEVLATWPILATYVEDKFWTGRFRSPPNKLHLYRREAASSKVLEAAEVVLLGAGLLRPFEPTPGEIKSLVNAWIPLSTDPDYS